MHGMMRLYTVEPLNNGHSMNNQFCPLSRGVRHRRPYLVCPIGAFTIFHCSGMSIICNVSFSNSL